MKHRSLVKLVAVALALLIAGLAPLPRRAVQLRVGSKKFTESVILGEMMRLLAEEAGLKVAHYREFGGTRIVFDALVAGEIDIYPEYTGTIAAEILAAQHVTDEKTMVDLLRQKGVGVSKSLGFSDTYALAMTRPRATQLGMSKISDLKRLPELQLALTHEFLDRADGWTALKRRYDLGQRNVVGVDHDVAYRQLLAGEVDVIDVYSTDAMIRRADLVLLKDDLSFFPRYDAVWLYRLDAAVRTPELLTLMQRLERTVSEATMQALNDEVEAGRKTESQAAADFLSQRLGVQVDVQTTSRTEMIVRHVLEHLDLVRRSLLPAIVVGIGLGILCQRNPRTGRVVLAAVGLLQTIPSLALLVLLLPIVAALGYRSIGEGSVTAVTALFCYCLLPIVRNTYTGIEGIPRATIESATVLGLGPVARLSEIELPIALPTLLAGIRTAAVQNVGFATLGAIIGAGGLGQPILRGIRINDVSLILAGAIPAAMLALLLQGSIDAIEWALVPRGLKRRADVQE
ncbi:MAG TPA: glycine betaine ABC transporter substrate-binding protein [Planctomycetaceae bacterium]|nr:glycine betaine ABC transporter substrate-binding protein [Planctomycetaceae bacterium]